MAYLKATESLEFIPDPRNKPQCQAFESKADILLYGGKPHGGKSFLQLLLSFHNHSNSLIIRRSFTELEAGLITDSKKHFPIDERYYNSSKHIWTLPKKKRITFGYGEKTKSVAENDFLQYKGSDWDYIGIDEASEIPRFGDGATVIDLLMPWNRTTIFNQRVRMLLSTNPGGVGEEWLIEWFAPWLDDNYIDPAELGELRYVIRDEKGNLRFSREPHNENAKSVTYIESSWQDNPYTMTDYEESLNLLPEPLRSQLLQGIWGIGSEDDIWQVIPSNWVRLAQERWQDKHINDWDGGGIDVAYGGADNTVLSLKADNWFANNKKWSGKQTPDGRSAARLIKPFVIHKRFPIFVDTFGFGADCYGELKSLGVHWVNCHFGNEMTEAKDQHHKLGFSNTRSEAWWRMREALDPEHGANIALPPDKKLLVDLTAPKWKQHAKGIAVESKDQIIKRLGRSPDDGDAVVMCWYAGYKNISKQIETAFGKTKELVGQYDGAF